MSSEFSEEEIDFPEIPYAEQVHNMRYITLDLLGSQCLAGDITPSHYSGSETVVSAEEFLACKGGSSEQAIKILWRGVACPPVRMTPLDVDAQLDKHVCEEKFVLETSRPSTDITRPWSLVQFGDYWTICVGKMTEVHTEFLKRHVFSSAQDSLIDINEPLYLTWIGESRAKELNAPPLVIMTSDDIVKLLLGGEGEITAHRTYDLAPN